MLGFISEHDLESFDGYLRYVAVDKGSLTPEQLATWATIHRDSRQRAASVLKVGRMALQPMAEGEHRYAVAVRDADGLWLATWVKRNPKGEFFVFIPRPGNWNVHTSYHSDGTIHSKSFGHKSVASKRQRPAGAFAGAEHLGKQGGHFPRSVGAVCDPSAFTDVVEVRERILGPKHGRICVDVVAPDAKPPPHHYEAPGVKVHSRHRFTESVPGVVVTILVDEPAL